MNDSAPQSQPKVTLRALILASRPLKESVSSQIGSSDPLLTVINGEYAHLITIENLLDDGTHSEVHISHDLSVAEFWVTEYSRKGWKVGREIFLHPPTDPKLTYADAVSSILALMPTADEGAEVLDAVTVLPGDSMITAPLPKFDWLGELHPSRGRTLFKLSKLSDGCERCYEQVTWTESAWPDGDHRSLSFSGAFRALVVDLNTTLDNPWNFDEYEVARRAEIYDLGNVIPLRRAQISLGVPPRATNNLIFDFAEGRMTKLGAGSEQTDWFRMVEKISQVTGDRYEFVPRIISERDNGYSTELYPWTSLGYQIETEMIPLDIATYTLNRVVYNLNRLHKFRAPKRPGNIFSNSITEVYRDRFNERWKSLAKVGKGEQAYLVGGVTLVNALKDLSTEFYQGRRGFRDLCLIHGDPVLSNVLFDQTSGNMKFIDPRGSWSGLMEPGYGDPLYDYAKVMQSLLGYDHIKMSPPSRRESAITFALRKSFQEDLENRDIDLKQVTTLAILLMASCIPLHGDTPHHQEALMNRVRNLLVERMEGKL